MIQVIEPKEKDLGGFVVKRVIPTIQRRSVSYFVFLDHMGPVSAGKPLHVRAHPHIGLSTVTYLFEGIVNHTDSLGTRQSVRAGDINWMTAGRGISHTEDSESQTGLHGLQIWVALPKEFEETDPSFNHYPGKVLPEFFEGAAKIKLLLGSAFDKKSPVKIHSEIFYFEVNIPKGKGFRFSPSAEHESAIYFLKGSAMIADQKISNHSLAVFEKGSPVSIEATEDSHFVVLGGEPLKESRHVWWNFVSSSREAIEDAKTLWKSGRFPLPPGNPEIIPLPES